MVVEGAAVSQWLEGVDTVCRALGWKKQGPTLIWLGMGSLWANDEMARGNVTTVASNYGELANKMVQSWGNRAISTRPQEPSLRRSSRVHLGSRAMPKLRQKGMSRTRSARAQT